MAEEKVKEDPESLISRLADKEKAAEVDVVAKSFGGASAAFSYGYPFSGFWEIVPSDSVIRFRDYIMDKYGDEDKANAAAIAAGYKSIEEPTDPDAHFDEIISFFYGPPEYIQTVYVTKGGLRLTVIAPFGGGISPSAQPGPFNGKVWTKASSFAGTGYQVITVQYYSDAEGKNEVARDERYIYSSNPNQMIEYFYGDPKGTGIWSVYAKKVFKKVAYSQKLQ